MRSLWIGFAFFFLNLALPVWSQQTQTSQVQSAATKDPQAIAVINQALIAAGGASAMAAITDYTATGNITYQLPQQVQGTVTLRALGVGQFRMDASLPTGVRSEIDTDTSLIADQQGVARSYPVPLNPSRIAIPVMSFIYASNSASLNVTYKGLVQLAGQTFHQIEFQYFLPVPLYDPRGYFRNFHTVDFFIDPTTLQIAMIQDIVIKESIRQIWYSDYRSVGGILFPFSMREQVDGQSTRQIQLSQVSVNSGLQDSDFQP